MGMILDGRDLPRDTRTSRAPWVVGSAAGVLAVALLWLAAEHRTLALWDVVVHESGRHTLGRTVLYFRHFLREIPTLIAMTLFLLAAYGVPEISPAMRRRARQRTGVHGMWLAAAGFLAAIAFGATAFEDGATAAWANLAQFYTRDDMTQYGSHWRFHWLSTIWIAMAAPLVAGAASRWFGAPPPGSLRQRRLLRAAAWTWFLGLTVVFVPTAEPFLDPRYIGHQAREILTHGLVTLPLSLGLIAWMMRRHGVQGRGWGSAAELSPLALVAFIGIPLFLGAATVFGDVMESGQRGGGLAAMVAAHFFEHTLDYVFVAMCSAGGFGLLLGRAGGAARDAADGRAEAVRRRS